MTALWIVLTAAVLFLTLIYLIYRKAFYSPEKGQGDIYNIPKEAQYDPYRKVMRDLIADLDARPFEAVTITSHDGLKLYGRYYHYHDGAPVDIAFHGYRGTAIRDMCGGIRLSYASKHNVLLVDQRAHGKSEGHTITFGIRERYDCQAWVNYVRGRFGNDVRILLYGVSMGAATVLMASDLDFGGSVCGILADCPFSSPREIIKKVCRDMNYPPVIASALAAVAARVFGGFGLTETTAEQAVKNSVLPIIIMHGEDDRFVPAQMSLVIAQARADIERYTFAGAAHGISGIVQPERYDELALRFIQKYCPAEK